jgi:hypothetical protein
MDTDGISEEHVDRYGDGEWVLRIPAPWQERTPIADRDWGYYGENRSGGGFTPYRGSAYRYPSKAEAIVKADRFKAEGEIVDYEVVHIPHPTLGSTKRRGTGGRA